MADYTFPTSYGVGTATISNGSVTVTGQGTYWMSDDPKLSPLRAGDLFGTHVGIAIRIDAVVSDTELTLAHEWPGESQSDAPYEIQLTPRIVGAQEATRRLLMSLANGNIEAFAGIAGGSDLIPIFTGVGTMSTVTRNSLVNGVDYDVLVDTLADRAAFDAQEEGYGVLVADVGDGRSALYTKRTNDAGDWTDPAYITGATGETGPYTDITFAPVQTLPPGSDVTMTVTPTGSGAVVITFGLPVGVPGDMEGPDGATNNGRPAFDGPSGKKLKEAPVTALETTFNNSVAGLKDNPATVQAAINVLATSPSGGANDAIFAIEIADLKGQRLGMVGGVADAFDDESGVNTGASSGQTYNAADDYYSPTMTAGASQIPTMTAATTAGVTMSDGGNSGSGFEAWRAADANQTGGWSQNPFAANNFLRVDFGSGNAPVIATYSITTASPNYPSAFKLQGSSDNSAWVDLDSRTGQVWSGTETKTFSVSSPVAYRYYRIQLISSASTAMSIFHIAMFVAGTVASMNLVSVPYAAAVVPASARMAIQVSGAQSFVVNTDLIGEVSRNGGASWTAASLLETTSLSGIRMYEADDINVSGQPSGSDVRWRIRTANGKIIQVSGVVLQWKD
jgi:hypothetical protein